MSFKEVMNEAARVGRRGKEPRSDRAFVQRTLRMGRELEFRLGKGIAEVDAMEAKKSFGRSLCGNDPSRRKLLIYAVNEPSA